MRRLHPALKGDRPLRPPVTRTLTCVHTDRDDVWMQKSVYCLGHMLWLFSFDWRLGLWGNSGGLCGALPLVLSCRSRATLACARSLVRHCRPAAAKTSPPPDCCLQLNIQKFNYFRRIITHVASRDLAASQDCLHIFVWSMFNLTSSNINEVFAGGPIHFDVALTEVVLVLAQRQVAVLLAFEPNQRLAIPTALLTETQRHAASAERANGAKLRPRSFTGGAFKCHDMLVGVLGVDEVNKPTSLHWGLWRILQCLCRRIATANPELEWRSLRRPGRLSCCNKNRQVSFKLNTTVESSSTGVSA